MNLDSDTVNVLWKNVEDKDDRGQENQDTRSRCANRHNTTKATDKTHTKSGKGGEETRCKVIERPYIAKIRWLDYT